MHEFAVIAGVIIGAGLIARIFPIIMTKIFDRYPQHFSPTNKSGSGDEIPTDACDRCGGEMIAACRARCAQCGWIRDC